MCDVTEFKSRSVVTARRYAMPMIQTDTRDVLLKSAAVRHTSHIVSLITSPARS